MGPPGELHDGIGGPASSSRQVVVACVGAGPARRGPSPVDRWAEPECRFAIEAEADEVRRWRRGRTLPPGPEPETGTYDVTAGVALGTSRLDRGWSRRRIDVRRVGCRWLDSSRRCTLATARDANVAGPEALFGSDGRVVDVGERARRVAKEPLAGRCSRSQRPPDPRPPKLSRPEPRGAAWGDPAGPTAVTSRASSERIAKAAGIECRRVPPETDRRPGRRRGPARWRRRLPTLQ